MGQQVNRQRTQRRRVSAVAPWSIKLFHFARRTSCAWRLRCEPTPHHHQQSPIVIVPHEWEQWWCAWGRRPRRWRTWSARCGGKHRKNKKNAETAWKRWVDSRGALSASTLQWGSAVASRSKKLRQESRAMEQSSKSGFRRKQGNCCCIVAKRIPHRA